MRAVGQNGPEDAAVHLRDALDAAEAAARRPVGWLRRPLRHLGAVVHAVTGPHEVRCEIFTGRSMRVVIPEIVGTQLYRYGFIEPQVTRVLIEHLPPGGVFFDVGAQYGYHAIVAHDLVGSEGTVVAFEPGRDSFRLLSDNLASTAKVITENLAAGAECGTVELHDFGVRNSALNTTQASARVPIEERQRLRAETYSVGSTTVDNYVTRTGLVPDFVKIDVEGAELDVLAGMADILRYHTPMLSLETGDYAEMGSPETVESIDFLEGLDYQCLEFRGSLQPHQRRNSYGYDNLFFVKRNRMADS